MLRTYFTLCFALLFAHMNFAQSTIATDKATQFITSQQGIFKDNTLSSQDLYISSSHISSISSVSHIYFQQTLEGIDILNAVGSVHLDNTDKIAHATNSFIAPGDFSQQKNGSIDALAAMGYAAGYYKLPNVGQTRLLSTIGGAAQQRTFANEAWSARDITTRLIYVQKDQNLVLTWEVFLEKPDDGFMVLAYVNAANGDITKTTSLTISCSHSSDLDCKADKKHRHKVIRKNKNITRNVVNKNTKPVAFAPNSYTVYAIPLEAPNEGAQSVVTEPWNHPAPMNASPFGWHDTDGVAGAESTLTRGNNVLASEDLDGAGGIGASPDGGATLMFDFPVDTSMQPLTYLNGAITNLFYMNNIMHDVTYQYGFDEAAGNFQFNNYGNGGFGNDDVRADAQDGSGLNNATFGTPVDGGIPQMTMFRWVEDLAFIDVHSPASVAGSYAVSGAAFNPIDVSATNDVSIAQPLDGCSAITNGQMVNGKIALIDRGGCPFVTKVDNAANAGAVAVIICNNIPGGGTFNMGGSGTRSIPSIMMSFEDCQTIRVEAGNGLNATIRTERTIPDKDSDLDNGIIAHEFGHGISNRLTGGANQGGCLFGSEQMGEGWSDYYSLMLQLKPGAQPEDRNGIGTYVTFDDPDGDGIRPFPYSTDFNVNPFTYNDIGSGVSIPHGVGSVWCTMLWDMTWNLIEKHGYDADVYSTNGGNGISMKLVMEGMKLQPCGPGFVDGRDGILMADTLLFGGANSCAIWRAFARRGLGVGASQGEVTSVTDGVESFERPDGCFDELILPCTNESLVYSGTNIPDGTDERVNTTISITNSGVLTGQEASLRAAQTIDIDPLFEVESTGELFLKTIPCEDVGGLQPTQDQKRAVQANVQKSSGLD